MTPSQETFALAGTEPRPEPGSMVVRKREYGEPWGIDEAGDIFITTTMAPLYVMSSLAGFREQYRYQRRAVACANALAGMDPSALAGLIAVCDAWAANSLDWEHSQQNIRAALAALRGKP